MKASDDLMSSTEADEATFSSRKYHQAKFLLGSQVLGKDGSFKPPILMPQASAIFDLKDTKMANLAMSSIFTSIMDKFHVNYHFL